MNLYQLLKKYGNDGCEKLSEEKYNQLMNIFEISESIANISSLVKATVHSKTVARICTMIAKSEGVSQHDIRKLEIAGIYHDVLKFEILSKNHALDIYKYLEGMIPNDVLSIIYNHSDKFNDTDKTKLQKILIDADILSKYSTEYAKMNTNESTNILYKNLINTKKFSENNLHFKKSKMLFRDYKYLFNLNINSLINLRNSNTEYTPGNKYILNVCYSVRNIYDDLGKERVDVGFSKILSYNTIRKNIYNIDISGFNVGKDEIISRLYVNVFNITTGENIITKSVKIYNAEKLVV